MQNPASVGMKDVVGVVLQAPKLCLVLVCEIYFPTLVVRVCGKLKMKMTNRPGNSELLLLVLVLHLLLLVLQLLPLLVLVLVLVLVLLVLLVLLLFVLIRVAIFPACPACP
jgi:hypothetical protein